MDRGFVQKNRDATGRLRKLAAGLKDSDMSRRAEPGWTVAAALAHIAFWDRRAQFVLDRTAQAGKLSPVDIDTVVNDLMQPAFDLIPGREAARLAIETAEALDKQLESFDEGLLEQIHAYNPRWVDRSLHRNEHMDEVDRALQGG